MLVDALSGSFAACAQLFTHYPLAVTRHCADRGFQSMVLVNHDTGPNGFFVLTQVSHDLFVIRSWHHQHGVSQGIRPGEAVSGIVHRVITDSLPVPRDGALLGWVTDSQVTVMLATYCRQSLSLDIPAPVPEILVMPMAGTSELAHWPPFASSPFDGRLWEYVERGQIVDIVPVLTHGLGRAYWVPAGVYMDHWILREGFAAPPVTRLLALPGVVDLAHRFR